MGRLRDVLTSPLKPSVPVWPIAFWQRHTSDRDHNDILMDSKSKNVTLGQKELLSLNNRWRIDQRNESINMKMSIERDVILQGPCCSLRVVYCNILLRFILRVAKLKLLLAQIVVACLKNDHSLRIDGKNFQRSFKFGMFKKITNLLETFSWPCFRGNAFHLTVLQSPGHPRSPGGPGGVERRRQMSRHAGSLHHAARVPGLAQSEAAASETARQRSANQVGVKVNEWKKKK